MTPAAWATLGVIVAALLSACTTFLVARVSAKTNKTHAEAAVQQAINDGFEKLTKGLHDELEATRGELTKARGEITDLRGWLREVLQHVESLEAMLRGQGIDVPKRVRPHYLAVIRAESSDR